MKRLTIILAVIGLITLGACSNDNNDVDNDTISEVFELRNVNFAYNAQDGYTIYRPLSPQIYLDDVILIYRLSGTIDSNTPIWQQIPKTLYLNEGELDYDFDFSKEDFTIYAGGNYDLSLTPNYLFNQTFRIVIVPGLLSNKMNGVDYSDYNAVIKTLKINDSKVKVLQ